MTEAPLPDDRLPEEETAVGEGVEGMAGVDRVEEGGDAVEVGERRYPSTIGGAFYLCILITVSIGFGIVVSGNWRLGVRWLAASLLAASVLRLVLPQRDAGMLAVRHRLVDCLLLAGVGVALLFLVATIPDQPL